MSHTMERNLQLRAARIRERQNIKTAWVAVLILLVSILVPLLGVASAHASTNSWPQTAIWGFATPDGRGFWIMYENGALGAAGTAHSYGDASHVALNAPITGGASTPTGLGYWLVSADGGIFSFGDAKFYGSMGGTHLNAPVFSMTATKSGHGYWLVAKDGGIFAFGDAKFYGSTAALKLTQPIAGLTTSPTGGGYRMVAKDGGVFNFGDAQYYGSLSALGIAANNVVGLAPTPTGHGYWVVRQNGTIYSFGDAPYYGNYSTPPCDAVMGVFANPAAAGYRLVTLSGATIPYGQAPGGSSVTGAGGWCHSQTTCTAALTSASSYQSVLNTRGPVWDGSDGGIPINLGDGRRLWMFGDTFTGPTDGTHVLPGGGFVRNSVAVESGSCFTYRLGGSAVATDYFTRPQVPGTSRWYWPESGVADPAAGVVYVAMARMETNPQVADPAWAWQSTGADLLTLDGKSLVQRSAQPMPAPGGHVWGTAMISSGGYVYLYAHGPSSTLYVARATPNNLADGHWAFADGSTWTTNAAAMRPVVFQTASKAHDVGPSNGLNVNSYGSGYLLTGDRCDILCNDVTAWYSASPAGPWRAVNANAGRIGTEASFPGQFV